MKQPSRDHVLQYCRFGNAYREGRVVAEQASERSIRDSVSNAVRLAHKKGFSSIIFLLIGAGFGGFHQGQAKAILLDELSRIDVLLAVPVIVFNPPIRHA